MLVEKVRSDRDNHQIKCTRPPQHLVILNHRADSWNAGFSVSCLFSRFAHQRAAYPKGNHAEHKVEQRLRKQSGILEVAVKAQLRMVEEVQRDQAETEE